MLILKPFIRITLLSMLLAALLIYLGVKYHWGDRLQLMPEKSLELAIPDKKEIQTEESSAAKVETNAFNPKIIQNNSANSLLVSMNKEQITEHCTNLLSKELTDELSLELATVNCVVSNYQDTFQNASSAHEQKLSEKRSIFSRQCENQYKNNSRYTYLEKQLLIGICISDRVSQN